MWRLARAPRLLSSLAVVSKGKRWAPSLVLSRSVSFADTIKTVQRDNRFNKVEAKDLEYFASVLDSHAIITNEKDLEPYNKCWQKKYLGHSKLCLRPKNTKEISQILSYCNERSLAVVPQGGNTGLVGGSVPLFDEVIVSTSRMNKVLAFDEHAGVLTAEAGCVLEVLEEYLSKKGFTMPLDLGAKGSCQIGGNVSTNAGGIRYVRYGSLHGNVLGLEAVLPNGTVFENLSVLRKDNTGYDLKQLFIGAEGTLGIVSKVSILCPRKPKNVKVLWFAVPSWNDLLTMMTRARTQLNEVLSAVEFLDRPCLEVVCKHIPGARDPLPSTNTPFYLLLEVSGSNPTHDQEKMDAFLEQAFKDGLVVDGTVAQDTAQATEIWKLRESVAQALVKTGAVYKYDLSVPIREMYPAVEEMKRHLKDLEGVKVYGYGHLGDGNLHLNVTAPQYSKAVIDKIEPYVFQYTSSKQGSISAEHGLGQSRNEYLNMSKPQPMIDYMVQIKKLFDPKGIMNPYKFLPSSK